MSNNVDYTRIIRYLEELGFDINNKNIYCYVLVISRVANKISKINKDDDVNVLLPFGFKKSGKCFLLCAC